MDEQEQTGEAPVCIRCDEDFPVAAEPALWTMGEIRPLAKAPKSIRDEWADTYRGQPSWLCGNCYFDLTD